MHQDYLGPVLVTGAGGRLGAVGRVVVELVRKRGLPVRAFVRREDERADVLRAPGAEVVVGDLTLATDVDRAKTLGNGGARRPCKTSPICAQLEKAGCQPN